MARLGRTFPARQILGRPRATTSTYAPVAGGTAGVTFSGTGSITAPAQVALTPYLALPTGASTPDQAAIGTSTPYDVRLKVAFQDYAGGVIYQALMGETGNIGNGTFRWEFYIDPSGFLIWKHYTAAAVNVTVSSTVALALANKRRSGCA